MPCRLSAPQALSQHPTSSWQGFWGEICPPRAPSLPPTGWNHYESSGERYTTDFHLGARGRARFYPDVASGCSRPPSSASFHLSSPSFGVIPWVILGNRALKVLAVCSLGTLGARGQGTFMELKHGLNAPCPRHENYPCPNSSRIYLKNGPISPFFFLKKKGNWFCFSLPARSW